MVVVAVEAADVDHPVDRGRPAEDLAARPGDAGAAEVLLRDGPVAVVDGAARELEEAVRVVDGRLVVHGPGLDEDDRAARVEQAAGDDRAAGSRADDDDVGTLGDIGAVSALGDVGALGAHGCARRISTDFTRVNSSRASTPFSRP